MRNVLSLLVVACVVLSVLLCGCLQRELSPKDIVKCKEGDYKPNDMLAKAMERRGYAVEKITLERDSAACEVIVKARDEDSGKNIRVGFIVSNYCLGPCLKHHDESFCVQRCMSVDFIKMG